MTRSLTFGGETSPSRTTRLKSTMTVRGDDAAGSATTHSPDFVLLAMTLRVGFVQLAVLFERWGLKDARIDRLTSHKVARAEAREGPQ